MALTNEEREWALDEIRAEMENQHEYCVDNHRMADADDSAEIQAFEQASFWGCCGSFEREVVHPNGKKILIGCNYGH